MSSSSSKSPAVQPFASSLSDTTALRVNHCLYDNDDSHIPLPTNSAPIGLSPSATTNQKLTKYSAAANRSIPSGFFPLASPTSRSSSSLSSASPAASPHSQPLALHSIRGGTSFSPPSEFRTDAAVALVDVNNSSRDLYSFSEVNDLSSPLSFVQKHSSGICLVRQRWGQNATAAKETVADKKLRRDTITLRADGDNDGETTGASWSPTWEALIIRRGGQEFYELPKGHVECGESLTEAAEREIREETGLVSQIKIGKFLTAERYIVKSNGGSGGNNNGERKDFGMAEGENIAIRLRRDKIPEGATLVKCVSYFRARSAAADWGGVEGRGRRICEKEGRTPDAVMGNHVNFIEDEKFEFGPRESATTEMRWTSRDEVERIFLKSKQVREAILMALTVPWSDEETSSTDDDAHVHEDEDNGTGQPRNE